YVQLHRAVNRGRAGLGRFLFLRELRRAIIWKLRRVLEPLQLHVLEQTFSSAFPAVTALAISSEAASCIEQIRAIHPNHTGLDLCCDLDSDIDVLAPYERRQSVDGVVGHVHPLL